MKANRFITTICAVALAGCSQVSSQPAHPEGRGVLSEAFDKDVPIELEYWNETTGEMETALFDGEQAANLMIALYRAEVEYQADETIGEWDVVPANGYPYNYPVEKASEERMILRQPTGVKGQEIHLSMWGATVVMPDGKWTYYSSSIPFFEMLSLVQCGNGDVAESAPE